MADAHTFETTDPQSNAGGASNSNNSDLGGTTDAISILLSNPLTYVAVLAIILCVCCCLYLFLCWQLAKMNKSHEKNMKEVEWRLEQRRSILVSRQQMRDYERQQFSVSPLSSPRNNSNKNSIINVNPNNINNMNNNINNNSSNLPSIPLNHMSDSASQNYLDFSNLTMSRFKQLSTSSVFGSGPTNTNTSGLSAFSGLGSGNGSNNTNPNSPRKYNNNSNSNNNNNNDPSSLNSGNSIGAVASSNNSANIANLGNYSSNLSNGSNQSNSNPSIGSGNGHNKGRGSGDARSNSIGSGSSSSGHNSNSNGNNSGGSRNNSNNQSNPFPLLPKQLSNIPSNAELTPHGTVKHNKWNQKMKNILNKSGQKSISRGIANNNNNNNNNNINSSSNNVGNGLNNNISNNNNNGIINGIENINTIKKNENNNIDPPENKHDYQASDTSLLFGNVITDEGGAGLGLKDRSERYLNKKKEGVKDTPSVNNTTNNPSLSMIQIKIAKNNKKEKKDKKRKKRDRDETLSVEPDLVFVQQSPTLPESVDDSQHLLGFSSFPEFEEINDNNNNNKKDKKKRPKSNQSDSSVIPSILEKTYQTLDINNDDNNNTPPPPPKDRIRSKNTRRDVNDIYEDNNKEQTNGKDDDDDHKHNNNTKEIERELDRIKAQLGDLTPNITNPNTPNNNKHNLKQLPQIPKIYDRGSFSGMTDISLSNMTFPNGSNPSQALQAHAQHGIGRPRNNGNNGGSRASRRSASRKTMLSIGTAATMISKNGVINDEMVIKDNEELSSNLDKLDIIMAPDGITPVAEDDLLNQINGVMTNELTEDEILARGVALAKQNVPYQVRLHFGGTWGSANVTIPPSSVGSIDTSVIDNSGNESKSNVNNINNISNKNDNGNNGGRLGNRNNNNNNGVNYNSNNSSNNSSNYSSKSKLHQSSGVSKMETITELNAISHSSNAINGISGIDTLSINNNNKHHMIDMDTPISESTELTLDHDGGLTTRKGMFSSKVSHQKSLQAEQGSLATTDIFNNKW